MRNWDFSYSQEQCVNADGDQLCKIDGVDSCVTVTTSGLVDPWYGLSRSATFYQACWEGYETGTTLVCEPCSEGRFRGNTDTSTHLVDAGVFCRSCLPGFYAAGKAYKECDACATGQYQTSCSKDDNDSNGKNDGCTRCKNCQAGRYQTLSGKASCVACAKGMYSADIGASLSTSCKDCDAGYYSDNLGSGLCTSCPRGWKSDGGAELCTSCESGTFAYEDGSSSCESCAAGKVTESSGLSSCSSCASGTETDQQSGIGGKSCFACAAGRYENAHVCQDCPSGWNQPSITTSACLACPTGRFAASPKTTSAVCSACTTSKYNAQTKQIACVACEVGRYTEQEAQSACSLCPAGYKSVGGATASLCAICGLGKSQPLIEKGQCTNCIVGRFSDVAGSTACKLCGSVGKISPNGGDGAYMDDVGKTVCKTCDASIGETASASRETCIACLDNLGAGTFSYVNTLGACQICQGCVEGSFKSVCTATSSCGLCSKGMYKDTSQTSVNSAENKGVGWDTACTACTFCPKGKFRTGGILSCMSTGAQQDDVNTKCQVCSLGKYKSTMGASFGEPCKNCETCLVGATRTLCDGDYEGICSLWTRPTVTRVDGSGQTGGNTMGGNLLNIYGKFLGGKRSNNDAIDVVVKYGPEDPPSSYTATNCEVIEPDNGLVCLNGNNSPECNVVLNEGHIRCQTAEGVGKDHKLTVQIGVYIPLVSLTFDAQIKYAAPIVAIYSGDGASNAITSGGQELIITGNQFGPVGTEIQSAMYGDGEYQLSLDASTCSVTQAHKEITCTTTQGAGKSLKLILKIGNQFSTIPAINYGVPQVRNKKCVTSANSGKYISFHPLPGGTTFCGCDVCPNILVDGVQTVPAITIGDGTCRIGTEASCLNGQPAPIESDINGAARLSTRGGQLIVISGVNLGRAGANSELESVTYGRTGTEVSIPVNNSVTLNSVYEKPGCIVLVATFSILCRTPPGIAGPHRWIVTVQGQKSQEIVTTSYSSPQIADANYTINTQGNEVVVFPNIANTCDSLMLLRDCDKTSTLILEGTEFGTYAAAQYEVIFAKGKWSSSCKNIGNCTGIQSVGSIPCCEIPATKLPELGGKERVQFTPPVGFGVGWNIRLIVMSTITGESTYTDFTSGTVKYAKPEIEESSVTETAADGYHVVTIKGENFCDRTLSGDNCGTVYRCGNGNSIADCNNNPHEHTPVSRIELWSDSLIKIKINISTGVVFIQTGQGGSSENFEKVEGFRSNFRRFSTESMRILKGGSFDKDLSNIPIISTKGDIELTVHVTKLGQKNNIAVQFNNREITIPEANVQLVSGVEWTVKFTVPSGIGALNLLYITRDSEPTENPAFISYEKPTISGIVLSSDNAKKIQNGVLSTEGGDVEISGKNFGDGTQDPWKLEFYDSTRDTRVTCSSHTHTKLVCALPPGSGKGFNLVMTVGGQRETFGETIDYAPPTVDSVTPRYVSTLNPGPIFIKGKNFGVETPVVRLIGTEKNCSVIFRNHTHIQCTVGSGQGRDHQILVIAGGQESSSGSPGALFSYHPPSVADFQPRQGRTDGLVSTANGQMKRQNMTITGSNFGTPENQDFSIFFTVVQVKGNTNQKEFVVPNSDIVSRDHNTVVIHQPQGYGEDVRITIRVQEQLSTSPLISFKYNTPIITKIRPMCGETEDQKTESNVDCYGFALPGYSRVQDYPKIVSIISGSDGTSVGRMHWVSGISKFSIAVGDTLQISGMNAAKGLASGSTQNFNGEWVVTGTDANDASIFRFSSSSRENVVGVIQPDTYLGWNNPAGNLRALVGKSYQSSSGGSFRLLETDGCSSIDDGGEPKSAKESNTAYNTRLRDRRLDAAKSHRKCKTKQKIVIEGTDFGSGRRDLSTPVVVSMRKKKCDCRKELSGEDTPCMDPETLQCFPKNSGETCAASYDDCSIVSDDVDASYEDRLSGNDEACSANLAGVYGNKLCRKYVELDVVHHDHRAIVVHSVAGYGRRHQIKVHIGSNNREATVDNKNSEERYLQYLPPSIQMYETNATVYNPDGQTKISFMGQNFGSGDHPGIGNKIEVRIGVEYDIDGTYCGDQDKCMKKCQNARWYPSNTDSTEEYRGLPYVECIIPRDTVGFKNVSLVIAGQRDDCSTNRKLCGYPINFPIDRRVKPLGPNSDLSSLVGDPSTGLVFTCAKSSMKQQTFAQPGELCQGEVNGECADAECTKPKSHEGFWRLDLDLEFACVGSVDKPCQSDITGNDQISSSESVMEALNPWAENDLTSFCFIGAQIGTNATECLSEQRLCSDRGKNVPGTCLFRRPLEARRALGQDFWPWSCPGANLSPWDNYNTVGTKATCKNYNQEAYEFVENLEIAGCPRQRIDHLVNLSKFEQYPGLAMSPTCHSVVACNPKESCLGDNQCAEGYEYQKYRCQAWNAKHPDKVSCTSDDQCRSRSNSTSQGETGLTSACDAKHPEDCARCVYNRNNSSESVGTCECVGGGPRCGLCRLPISAEDSHDGIERKGYFRLNDECQECPEDPGLLLALMAAGIVVFCVVGWWMQDKKINVAFLSIGVDYFQVLAIFARLRIRWPPWMKNILEFMSIFNFNIDIAAPECLIQEFDYKTKWIIIMLLPLIFAGILLLIFLLVMCIKLVKKLSGTAGKATRYCSHGNKLIAMFIIIFYFIYLSVTRRALDVFNCKPVDPPDGYLYTEFTSIECEGGICRCDDPNELQMQLKFPAALGVIVYSIGFPLFVFWLTWFYRIQMKADQLLRAYDLGDERSLALEGMRFTARRCRSTSRRTYDIRKKYHKLYYHFKPGKVYWMLMILARKFLIALFALLFRANIAFMLAIVILILFASYVLQVRNRPYMSTVERVAVKEAHRLKANAAITHLATLQVNGQYKDDISSELRLHMELNRAILNLRDDIERRNKKRRSSVIRNLNDAQKRIKDKKVVQDYYFDYNTVEQVLLMCSVFLCLVAIMLESGQFYETNVVTGIATVKLDDTTQWFYNTVVVIGGIVLIGSMLYYFIVFLAEVVGHVPTWVRVCFASKKTRAEKHAESNHMEHHRSQSKGEDDFEMSEISVFNNQLGNNEKQQLELRRQKMELEHAQKRHDKQEKQSKELMEQMRKLKQENYRQTAQTSSPRTQATTRTTRVRKEMAQVRPNTQSDNNKDGTTRQQTTSTSNPMQRSSGTGGGYTLKKSGRGRQKRPRKQAGKKRPGDDIGNKDL